MSSCLFNGSSCPHSRCCLNFANPYDLIAHIEDFHCNIPPINVVDSEQNKFVRPNSIYNLFPGGYKPTPVPKLPTKLNFECYKKRTTSVGSLALSRMRGSESERTDDGEDGDGDGEERKYKCTIDGCDRRYKNLQGVKYHMRSAHGKPEDGLPIGGMGGGGGGGGPIPAGILPIGTTMNTLDGTIAATVGQVVSSSTALGLPPPTPTKYAMSRPHKCPHCCKRYKTTQGMNNHMASAHNKQAVSSSGSLDSSANSSSVNQSVHEILARTAKEVQAQEEMREQQALLEGKTVGAVLQSGMARHAQLRTLINQQQQQQQQQQAQQQAQQQQQTQQAQQQQSQQVQLQQEQASVQQAQPMQPTQTATTPIAPPQSPMAQQPATPGGGGGGGGGPPMQSHPHPHHIQPPQQMQQQPPHMAAQQQQQLQHPPQSMQHHQQMQQQSYYQQHAQSQQMQGQPQYMPQRTVREEMMEKMEQSRGAGGISLPPLNPSPQRRMRVPPINMPYRDDMVSSSMDASSSSMHPGGGGGGGHMMSSGPPQSHVSHPSHPHSSHQSHSSHPSHSSHSSHPHGPPTSTVRLLPPAEDMFHQRESVSMDQSHYRGPPPPGYQSLPPSQYQRGPPLPQPSYHHQLAHQQSDGYGQQSQQQRLGYSQDGEGGYLPSPRPLPPISATFNSDSSYQYAPTNQYGPPQGPPGYSNQPQYDPQSYPQQGTPHYYGEDKRDGRSMDHHDYSR